MALLLAGIVWAVRPSLRTMIGFHSKSAAKSPRSRDVYADSPYWNARPGVGYVGDAACVRCHREIAEAYHSHPMGRSLAPVGGPDEHPQTGTAPGLSLQARGLLYTIERRDDRVFHKATQRGAHGEVLTEIEAEVRCALGSGTRGTNFLIERDGFLFLSPIAWFAQQGRWAISPGYGDRTQQTNFERAIYPDCLFCHTNQVRPVAGPLDRYETPIFQGYAIGCERCHGPGELHVREGGSSAESDLTIVNPAGLAPALRGIRSVSNAISRGRSAPRGRAETSSTSARAFRCTGSGRSSRGRRETETSSRRSATWSSSNRVAVSARASDSLVASRATIRTGSPSHPLSHPLPWKEEG